MESAFSVVIATHNRRHIVARAITSALTQNDGRPEVIVVDDASADGTGHYVTTTFPEVRYHAMPASRGPGPSRNFGIRSATGRWVLVLDDDDELRPDASSIIRARLADCDRIERFPVVAFGRTDGALDVPFEISRVPDLWGRHRHGNFVSVWNRDVAAAAGCAYPEHRLGAEALMWIEVAERYGIPTWADCVGIAHREAGPHLLARQTDPKDAADRAGIADAIVRGLAPYDADPHVHRVVTDRILSAGTYLVMAGQRGEALKRARTLLSRQPIGAVKLAIASVLPRSLVVRRFLARRRQAGA